MFYFGDAVKQPCVIADSLRLDGCQQDFETWLNKITQKYVDSSVHILLAIACTYKNKNKSKFFFSSTWISCCTVCLNTASFMQQWMQIQLISQFLHNRHDSLLLLRDM